MQCEVPVVLPNDERKWATVEARSLFTVIFAYKSDVIAGQLRHGDYPRGAPSVEFEVKTEDGRSIRTSFDAAMRSASKQKT
jgi:hypothetical protein